MKWDLYVVLRNESGISKNQVHKISERIFQQLGDKVEKMVYIGEKDNGNWKNYHINILIRTDHVVDVIDTIKKINKCRTLYIEKVKSNQSVGYYVTKFIPSPGFHYNRDIEWNILYNRTVKEIV